MSERGGASKREGRRTLGLPYRETVLATAPFRRTDPRGPRLSVPWPDQRITRFQCKVRATDATRTKPKPFNVLDEPRSGRGVRRTRGRNRR